MKPISKKELLLLIQEALEEDRLADPQKIFQRMIDEKLIDINGLPIQRERKLYISNREPEHES